MTNPTGVSVLFGVALAVLGSIALAVGMVDFLRTRREIDAQDFTAAASVGGYIVLASASLILAGAFIVYIVLQLM